MTKYKRIKRQQILREAEGYLDLITVFADQWPVTVGVRDRVARRALAALRRLGRGREQRAHVLYLRGQAHRCMERHRDAISALQQSAELDPENLHVWLALGWCHKRCGRLDLAIQALEEALTIDGTEAITHYNLACYWSLACNPKLAISYLTRAFDINPNYRDLVSAEQDFDPIRDHPDFQALTTVIV